MRPLKNTSGATAALEAHEHMKTRIITAAILVPLLLIILLILPKLITAILFGLLAAIAVYELLMGTGYIKQFRLVAYGMVMAFLVSLWSGFGAGHVWAVLGIVLFACVLFAEMMLSHIKLRFEKICICFVAALLIPYLFTALVRIHADDTTGRYFILIPFILAFLSDSGAYFAGCYLGKHKLAPAISPKKTIEGAIGGVLAAVAFMLLYTLILQLAFDFKVNYGFALLYGVVGSVASVFGDLCFSVIKRQTGIKDYGNLIPGHGGVLDRFDSMIIVAPVTEAMLILIPLAVK